MRAKTRSLRRGHIPRVVVQTAKDPIPPKISNLLRKQIHGYAYTFFSDADILAFFQENPDRQYPHITEVFHSFTTGAHRADLFRCYYLYKKGGVYIDSDLILYDPLTGILGKNTFVSVWDVKYRGAAFNGFIAAVPNHPIMAAALKKLYTTSNATLVADYLAACKDFGRIISEFRGGGVKMMVEVNVVGDHYCETIDPDTGKLSLVHYYGGPIPEHRPEN